MSDELLNGQARHRRAGWLRHRPPLAYLVLLYATYFLAGGLSQGLALIPGVAISFWPPVGILLATLLLTPRSRWPWWILAGGLAELTFNVFWHRNPLPFALIYYAANALEALTAAWLIHTFAAKPFRLTSLDDVLAFVVLGAGVAPVVSATIIAVTDALLGKHPFTTAWPLVWLGDGSGLLISAPLTFALVQAWRERETIPARRIMEAVVIGLLLLGVGAFAFRGYLPTAYALLPPLLWAAARFQLQGATVALGLVTVITATFTATGTGEFTGDPEAMREKIVMLQTFLGIAAASALVVGVLSLQRQQAMHELRTAYDGLERQVAEKTAETRAREADLQLTVAAVPALIAYVNDEFRFRWANGRFRPWFGRGPEDIAGRHVREVVGEPVWEIVRPYMARALAGEAVTFEVFLPYTTVSHKWVTATYTPDMDPTGRVRGFVEHVVDVSDLKQAELTVAETAQTLRRERKRLALALRTGRLGAYEWQVGEHAVWWSADTYTLFGVDPATFTPTIEAVNALVHPDDRAKVRRRTEESLARRSVFELEYRVVGPDGAVRWFYNRSHVEADAAGSERVTGLVTDITDRKTQAVALEERSDQLALLARVSQRLILGHTSEADVLHAVFADVAQTIGAEMYFNYAPNDETSMRLHTWGGLTDDERTRFATMQYGELLCGRVAARRQPIIVEDIASTEVEGSEAVRAAGLGSYAGFPLLAGDRLLGTIAFVTRTKTHFRPGEVQTIQTVCDQVAATLDRVHLAAELRTGEERLRMALSAAQAGAWEWNVRTGVITWSQENYALYGFDPAAGPTAYADWEKNIHPDDRGATNAAVQDTLTGRTAKFRAEFRILHPTRDTRWLLGLGQVERDSAGEPVRMTGINLEITERKRFEAELKMADRRKDEFLATLAHELRNPLASVRNAVAFLRAKGPDIPELHWARDLIDRQTQILVRLIDDLMDVSRISQGRFELQRQHVDLAKLVMGAVETSRPLIDEMGHVLTVTLPSRPVIVDADLIRLPQVVMNLLNNAAKYTPRGGQIDLRAELQGSDVVVSVKDTGVGIPSDRQSTIFELFSQIEETASRSQGGLGIGLHLAKRLVEMHDGRIEVRSGGPGLGSEFVVRLPIVVEQTYPLQANGDGARSQATADLRILVVDDNRDAAESAAMLLKMMGNQVQIAHDGEEAVAAAREFRPHVVLCDIGLPKMNGYEAGRQMKAEAWDAKMILIAVTGWGQASDRRRSEEAGFDHHLVKPVDPQALMTLLAGLATVKAT